MTKVLFAGTQTMRFIQRHEGQTLIVRGVAIKIWAAQHGRVLLGLADDGPEGSGQQSEVRRPPRRLPSLTTQLRLFDPDQRAA